MYECIIMNLWLPTQLPIPDHEAYLSERTIQVEGCARVLRICIVWGTRQANLTNGIFDDEFSSPLMLVSDS